MDELKKKRFVWGVVLAWAPWLIILVGLSHTILGISRQEATGIGGGWRSQRDIHRFGALERS